ncbi:MAG: hypothetical protein V4722_06920 [Bacteroidota bacterium]
MITVLLSNPTSVPSRPGNKATSGIAADDFLPGKKTAATTLFSGNARTFFHVLTKDIGHDQTLVSVLVQYKTPGKSTITGNVAVAQPKKIPFLQLHGNIAYTFDYRSRLDTPFAATNLQQHNEQVYADASIKGRYPFRIILNSRQSNSPFFKNYTDINVQFNGYGFKQNLRNELADAWSQKLQKAAAPVNYEMLVAKEQQAYEQAKRWVESSMRTQEIVAEKEIIYAKVLTLEREQNRVNQVIRNAMEDASTDRLQQLARESARQAITKSITDQKIQLKHFIDSVLAKQKNKLKPDSATQRQILAKEKSLVSLKDSLEKLTDNRSMGGSELLSNRTDSLVSVKKTLLNLRDSALAEMALPGDAEKKLTAAKKALDSLRNNMTAAQRGLDSVKNDIQTQVAAFTNAVQKARSVKELNALAKNAGTNGLGSFDKQLLAITQFGIGRATVNYSDLTVNNISLSGVNVEYNPSIYLAFATGTVDYLFRDFIVRPLQLPKQNLLLGRFGWGDKDNRTIIITSYTGSKNRFGGNVGNPVSTEAVANNTRLFGYSIEARYKLDDYTNFSFEAAKSSTPYTLNGDRAKSLSRAFSFTDRNNEAWTAKFSKDLPAMQSNLNVFYRKVGAHFQSYSLFTSGNRQEAWGIKWKQYLFQKRLALTGQVRKNGFDNPLVSNTYNSSVVFKSLQAVMRIKKWPMISLGYMPGSQLTKNTDGTLSENIYQTLTANLFYTYTAVRRQMSSSLLYTRFYNRGTDTGFVYYNARNIMMNHHMDFGWWRSQTDVQYAAQPNLNYWTFQQQADLQIGKSVGAGVGAKNYRLTNGTGYWGMQMQVSIQLQKLGTLQMQYDKGYLPNGIGQLASNDWGRLSWVRIF